jgi:hypothetical protein
LPNTLVDAQREPTFDSVEVILQFRVH